MLVEGDIRGVGTYLWRRSTEDLESFLAECANFGQTEVGQARQVLQEVVDSGDRQVGTVREVDSFERGPGVESVERRVCNVGDLWRFRHSVPVESHHRDGRAFDSLARDRSV